LPHLSRRLASAGALKRCSFFDYSVGVFTLESKRNEADRETIEKFGGEGGIRTPVTVPRELDFESRED